MMSYVVAREELVSMCERKISSLNDIIRRIGPAIPREQIVEWLAEEVRSLEMFKNQILNYEYND